MIDFLKKYWLFIIINAALVLIAVMIFMFITGSPQEGGVIYQAN